MLDHEEETPETARIPLDTLQAQLHGTVPPQGLVTVGAGQRGVSVTQAIRVRRSQNKRPPSGLLSFKPRARKVAAWSDAAFPAVVSFLFTGPLAYQWFREDKGLAAVLMTLGVAGATFTCVSLFSRTLDRPSKSS